MSDPQILVRKKRAYSAVPDDILTNKSLSVSARLVLAYMIGRPDGWVIYVSQVCSAIGIGTGGQWRRVRNELENAGFFSQTRTRARDGKIKWHHEVTDVPTILSKPTDGEPIDGGTIHGDQQDITIGLEQRIKQRIAAAPRKRDAAAALQLKNPPPAPTHVSAGGKRRRVRPSGIVTWTDDDENEAVRIEREAPADDIAAAVLALQQAGRGADPVPGRVGAELARLGAQRQAAERAAARRAEVEAAFRPVDPAAAAVGRRLFAEARKKRASGIALEADSSIAP